jgi:hypothetical protein
MSGVAISASKAVQFSFWIFSTISSPPTKSAPASVASFWRSPLAITATVLVLPSPCGRTTVPRTIWSAWRVSTPKPHGQVDGLVELGVLHLLEQP